MRLEKLVELFVVFGAVEPMVLEEKEEALEGEHLAGQSVRVIQAG